LYNVVTMETYTLRLTIPTGWISWLKFNPKYYMHNYTYPVFQTSLSGTLKVEYIVYY